MKKLLLVVGVGCLSLVLLVVVALGGTMAWAVYQARQLGDPTPTRVERSIPVRDAQAGAAAVAGDALELDIDLSEGMFTIQPGPAGSDVMVEANYAEGYYDLLESREPAGSGRSRMSITFRPKASFFVRAINTMLSGGSGRDTSLTLSIPQDLPVDLSLRVGLGEARIDLGGLALAGLEVNLSMGNHALDFSRPVSREIADAALRFNMGNITVEHLGNARIQRLDASGSMGNMRADLDGDWQSGTETEVTFRQSMGELRLNVPRSVRLEVDADESATGENVIESAEAPDDPDAPVVRMRLSTSMASTRVSRY